MEDKDMQKMKVSKLIIHLLLVLPALAACNDKEDMEMPRPVGFSTTVEGAVTRYASNDLPPSLGVLASQTAGNFNASSRLDFMYNQEITRNGNTWSYSPAKYWPTNANDKISFFAYAPHNATGVTLCSSTSQGYPTFTYTVPPTEGTQTDLLVAAPVMNQNGGNVNFTLKHTLTKVSFLVKCGDKYAKEVTSLSVTAASQGEAYFTNGASDFGWRNISATTSSFTPTTATVNLAPTDKEKNIATFYLLPTGTVSSTFSITYKVKAADGTQIHEKIITNQALPASPLWNAGSSVVYTLNLSEETVTVTTEANSSWESAGSEEKTVRFYTADELKAGDYYYSDGTTSDGGLRQSALTNDAASGGQTSGMLVGNEYIHEAKSPVAGKTCIGIVFYVGEGPGDDVANYVETSLTRIDGYVVALRDAGNKISWGPTGGGEGLVNVDSKTDTNFNGYANTKKVKELAGFGNYPAFTSAVNYSAGVSLPSTASTWYLPSIAQLRSIYSANGTIADSPLVSEKMISLNLKKCSGAQTFRAQRYWSSSPYNADIALYMGFYGGDLHLDAKKNLSNIYHVRSILTFQRVTN